MLRLSIILVSILSLICLASCFSEEIVSVKGVLASSGIPPVLVEVQSMDERRVRFVFNKEVEVFGNSFEPFTAQSDGYGIVVTLDRGIKPGEVASVSGRVADEYGNTTGFSSPVWGFNPNPAGLLVNEVCSKTESKTELKVIRSGNLAGLVLYNGVPESYDGRCILPDFEAEEGAFIVIWFSGEVKAENNLSTGGVIPRGGVLNVALDSVAKGYSNNGIQTLALSPAPGAKVVDCVVYSNHASKYSGYGNAGTEKNVMTAVKNGWWDSVDAPVDSTKSTKLRTMCRRLVEDGAESLVSVDTDSAADWYITENKGATFGRENDSGEYEP